MKLDERYKKLGIEFSKKVVVRPSIRINTLKIKPEKLIQRLRSKAITLEKIDYLDFGYYYDSSFSLASTQEYLQGYYYIQEAASQLPVQVLDVEETDNVLDMAASPGSKTTQLGQYTKGLIVALDNQRHRLEALKNNIERLSIPNVLVLNKDARFADTLGEFDKVLLDAPCSGNFCVNPNYYNERNILDIQKKAEVQKELIKTAVKCLKKGGVIVYSTCSLEPEENEEIIDYAIKELGVRVLDTGLLIGDEGLVDIFGKKLDKSISKTKRFWPHKTATEGFFIAKLTK
ncbi:MAG: NOL1/NOP2/sun family putative RNA methylase [Candidatus Woesearchaeota archaeon]